MLNKQIYILQGTTGEYSDRQDWLVRAYADEADAIKAQQDLTDAFARLWKYMQDNNLNYYELDYIEYLTEVKDIDPFCSIDYTGTSWWVKPIFFQE